MLRTTTLQVLEKAYTLQQNPATENIQAAPSMNGNQKHQSKRTQLFQTMTPAMTRSNDI